MAYDGSKTQDYRPPKVAREGLKPSAPQVYGICRCALERHALYGGKR